MLGMALLLGGVGWFIRGRVVLSADSALVVAPAEEIRAPADGLLNHGLVPHGVLAPKQILATVQRVPEVDPELRAIQSDLESARADIDSLKSFIGLGESLYSKTSSRESVLRGERSEHLRRMLVQTESAASTQRAAMEAARRALERAGKLCEAGLMSARQCDDIRAKAEVTEREYESTQKQVNTANFLLESNRRGVDAGQGIASEAIYARQYRNELTLRLATLRHDLVVDQAKVKALEARIAVKTISVSTSGRARILSIFRQSNGYVTKGEVLFRIVGCDQSYVLAIVKEASYEKLRVGSAAVVKMHDQTYRGRVVELLGSGDDFSIPQHRWAVTPLLDRGARASAIGLVAVKLSEAGVLAARCDVGSAVDVTFPMTGND
jgi:multidrug resistance efflux pump